MTITASQVSSLRQRTGVGMMAVKNALEEASGDEEKAIEILRKRGEAQAVKKSGRDQSEGLVFIESNDTKAVVLSLACETDFVARADDFLSAGKALASKALAEGAEAAKKHADEIIPNLVNKLGENLSLRDMHAVEGSTLGTYMHTNNKIGVIVTLEGGNVTQARDVAMHAAAMAPEVVNPEDITDEAVEKEKEIWKEQLARENKPAEIQEKIMIGKERKFREESALMKQEFVKDPSKTIEQYLDGAKVKEYVRVSV